MFMVVIACHIPFIFFSGKEGLLIIVDELDRRSISNALEKKMKTIAIGENEKKDFAMPQIDNNLK